MLADRHNYGPYVGVCAELMVVKMAIVELRKFNNWGRERKKGPGSNYFWQKGKTSKHPFPKINVVCPLFGRYFPETIIHYFEKKGPGSNYFSGPKHHNGNSP